MTCRWFALIFGLLILANAPGRAGDKIWSAVLLANNVADPKPAPSELKPVAARLQRIFGCNQFEIVGKDTATVEDASKFSLTPTKTFWLNIQARRASIKEARGGYLLNLELFQDQRPLVDTVALIAPASPLVFRGPMCSKGQVIVVLQVQP
jgi:hypothetical protein